MKPGRKTRYMSFPRSKVYHKLGEGTRTLCGLETTAKGGQRRMFVTFALAPIPEKRYCENCSVNERFGEYTMANLLRRPDAKDKA